MKRVSPYTANRRVAALSVEPKRKFRYWRHVRGRWVKYPSPYEVEPEATAVHRRALALLEYHRMHGRWPNYDWRWVRKDRLFRRAMREAKRMMR